MADRPRYIYFNGRARGELPRLICAASGIDYIDERIQYIDWVSKYKSMTPYGQIPVLEIDGKIYAQKLAISLYFARIGGLYPKSASELEFLKYEHALLFLEDVIEKYVSARIENLFLKKPETLEKIKTEIFPLKLPLLEKLLKQNGTGYFVGNKLTIVDLGAYDLIEHVVDEMGKDYLNSYPLIAAHFEKVGQIKGIKEYVDSRPPSDITW